MTGTTNGHDVDWRRVLERAEKQAVNDPDYIGCMVQAVEAQLPKLVDLDHDGASLDQAKIELTKALDEVERLTNELEAAKLGNTVSAADGRVTHLQDQVEAQQRELEALGQQQGDVLQRNLDLEERVDTQRAELDAVNAERDQLREKLATALKVGRPRHTARPQHVHQYPQDGPDYMPRPCECGKPFPRTAMTDLAEAEYVLSGWDALWKRIRDDAEAAGWADSEDADPDSEECGECGAGSWEPCSGGLHELRGTNSAGSGVEREAKRSTRKVAVCGTESGYGRHRNRGEDACEPCKAAVRVAQKRRADAKKNAAEAGDAS